MQMPAVVSIIALSAGAGVRIGSAVRTGIVVFKIGWAVPRARKTKIVDSFPHYLKIEIRARYDAVFPVINVSSAGGCIHPGPEETRSTYSFLHLSLRWKSVQASPQ